MRASAAFTPSSVAMAEATADDLYFQAQPLKYNQITAKLQLQALLAACFSQIGTCA